MQYVFNRMVDMTTEDEPATKTMVESAIDYILSLFAPMFKELFVRMSERQKSLLIAVSKDGHVDTPTGEAFISRYSLKSASSVQGAMKALLQDETISFYNGTYFITNRFFSLWLAARY